MLFGEEPEPMIARDGRRLHAARRAEFNASSFGARVAAARTSIYSCMTAAIGSSRARGTRERRRH
jgi:citrate synthase